MARPAGFEPATVRLEGGCSIQLSYERIKNRNQAYQGINWSEWRDSNPRPSGPKPDALPSCAIHRRMFRFEPNQNWKLCYQNNGVANEIRTRDHRNHNPGLYQLSYSHHYFFANILSGWRARKDSNLRPLAPEANALSS